VNSIQKKRAENFKEFSTGDVPILIATDIASRGLDITVKIEHVILYDFPKSPIDYLHRAGRTARAGESGVVSAFVGKEDQAIACKIRDAYEKGISLSSVWSKEYRYKSKKDNPEVIKVKTQQNQAEM